jgi:hypothetical protein
MLFRPSMQGSLPLYECSSDYLYNMSALTRKEARRLWRQSIKEAWGNKCAYCGNPPIDDSSLTIDHVRPKSKGGSDKTSNVTPACLCCNHSKGSEDWISWYRRQEFYSVYREWRIRQWLASDCNIVYSEYECENKAISLWADELGVAPCCPIATA